ncbi:UNVERIFIED_CONTAM: Zinc finger CCCH domain-containing protein 17 [Sesamum angustifolium]|uniref:Zinc finger CCCH domain-containing protein 17 n=1 Tax=Sesamum angustifolium TaxID=2727405 RepID=A0AAW2M6Q4_9LAMI
MVGSAPQSQSQSQSQPPSAEEEALKRNTDCVYFLASPLTCKKGSECEYRHSDIARVNPRDCWFWLHGNCLNPKCGFRHPPLDGLLGAQIPTPTGASAPVSQAVTAPTPTPHVPNASTKQGGVPCIFFQKGHCLKGDWCPFLHIPNSLNNKASQAPGTASAAEPATIKKSFTGLEKSMQEKKLQPMNIAKSVKDVQQSKPITELEHAPPRNEFSINRRVPHLSGINEFPAYRSAPVSNGNPVNWSNRVQQPHLLEEPESMNSKDAEEVSREPSPGFDVLVDDEGRDSDYYPGEDRYGMSREHEARSEYDIGHTIAAGDDERYQDPLGYDSHEHHKGQYAWEQHRASSEKMSGGAYLERRQYARPDSVGQVDELDLRHRLAKHKKPNGLRSVISHEHARDLQAGDCSYQGLRRDEQQAMRDNSLSSRLRGRIRLPGRSSSPTNRDMIRGSDRGRLSPIRAGISSHQGRIRDKIKGRVEEGFNNGGRNHRGLPSRRDSVGQDSADFAGPKSLAELKNRKNAEPSRQQVSDQQSLGKRKHLMLDGHQQSGSDVSFEGPKSLDEILKRKRGEPISGRNSSNNEGIIENKNQEEEKDATNNETTTPDGNNKEGYKSATVQKTEAEESRPTASGSALQPDAGKLEVEEGMVVEDGVDQESEAYEQRDGESDYEQAGGEDFELYDGENGDAVGEYDEDDDDDFAKKMVSCTPKR